MRQERYCLRANEISSCPGLTTIVWQFYYLAFCKKIIYLPEGQPLIEVDSFLLFLNSLILLSSQYQTLEGLLELIHQKFQGLQYCIYLASGSTEIQGHHQV